jgi:MYXO-CTERM domain-containing protein
MVRSTRLFTSTVFSISLALVASACGAPQPAAPVSGDHDPEVVLTGRQVMERWTLEDGFYVSPVLDAPAGASRVGLMFDVVPDAGDAAVGFQARAEGQAFAPVRITWVEHPVRVGFVDLGVVTRAAQLRVPALDAPHLALLVWSAVIPQEQQAQELTVRDTAGQPVTVDGLVSPRVQQAISLPGVNDRASWGARATLCTSLNATKTRISVHHTVTPVSSSNYAQRIRGIQTYHMDTKGWCDIGYHFMVTSDGAQWEAREAQYLGTHVGGANTNNLGVSFIGCFHPGVDPCTDPAYAPVEPPEVMISGGGELIGKLAAHYGISVNTTTVIGHRDNPGQTTSCPGNNLHDRLADLRAIASGVEPGPDPDPEPAPTTGTVQGVVWDLAVTDSAAASADVGARLPEAILTVVGEGESTTAREGDAYWSFDLAPGFYEIAASLDGYATATREVQVTAGGEAWASIGLSPTSDAVTLTVSVYDADQGPDAALEHATVTAGAGDPVQTDSLGEAELVLAAGEISVTAVAEGFEPLTQSITLVAGEPSLMTFGLMPTDIEEPSPEPDAVPAEPDVTPEPDATPEPDTGGPIDLGEDRDVDQVAIPTDEAPGCMCVTSGDGDASGPVLALVAFGLVMGRRRRRG